MNGHTPAAGSISLPELKIQLAREEKERKQSGQSSVAARRAARTGVSIDELTHPMFAKMNEATFAEADKDGDGMPSPDALRKQRHSSRLCNGCAGMLTFEEMIQLRYPGLGERDLQEIRSWVTPPKKVMPLPAGMPRLFCRKAAPAGRAQVRKLSQEQNAELKQMFRLFDVDKNGELTIPELLKAFARQAGESDIGFTEVRAARSRPGRVSSHQPPSGDPLRTDRSSGDVQGARLRPERHHQPRGVQADDAEHGAVDARSSDRVMRA